MIYRKSIHVSVIMITYGHKAYIAEAIEGVLMQEVDFPVELIIADDCSPDDTATIVQEFINNHPKGSWIKYTRHSQNKGMMPNFIWALEQAKGNYIALCEGDDFWTDPYKLQKQVDFLEANEEFVLSFHNAEKLFADGSMDLFNTYNKSSYSPHELWDQWLIATASVVYRNVPLNFPEWFIRATHGDLGLFLLLGEYGKFGCLPEAMCVYRIHEEGVTNSVFKSVTHRLNHIAQLKAMNVHFTYKYHDPINTRLIGYYLSTSYLLAKNGSKKQVIHLLLQSLRTGFLKSVANLYLYKTILYLVFSWKTKNP
jgi:glycosyltransferase involved in cell wall biosynthesis